MNYGKRFPCYVVFYMLRDMVCFYGSRSKITEYILYK